MLSPEMISHRPPLVAGSFYPSDAAELSKKLHEYLQLDLPLEHKDKEITGIVVPHAGYVFSGYIAGMAFRELYGRNYDLAIIISPSHTKYFKGSCVFNGDAYLTPLGAVWVDREFSEELAKINDNVFLGFDGHSSYESRPEHALEVQIPFLQKVLPNTKIVPVVMGSQDEKYVDDLAKSIYLTIKKLKKRAIIISSSDLSHFHNKTIANSLDSQLLYYFKAFDYFKLEMLLKQGKTEACGGGPIIANMKLSEQFENSSSEVIYYSTSADSYEYKSDSNRVVGYFSGIIFKSKKQNNLPYLTEKQKKEIINFTKKVIKNKIRNTYDNMTLDIKLDNTYASFVTIKKNKMLRACMGHLFSTQDLSNELKETAELSATSDYRFGKLNPNELDEIEIEISLLSRFIRMIDYNLIEIGKHGIYLKYYDEKLKNYKSGILLPQVALEHNLNKEQFLESLCIKAGVDKDAYKKENAEIYVFESLIISE